MKKFFFCAAAFALIAGCSKESGSNEDPTNPGPESNPPKIENVCDKCGKDLYIRDDDSKETVANRLKTYHEQTEPLKEFYEAKGLLVTVIGQEKVEDTTALVFKALDGIKA